MTSQVLVIGGTGRTGRKIVEKLHQRNRAVRVMVRNPASMRHRPPNGVNIALGDITDAQAVATAMKGIDGVVIIVESAEEDHGPNSPRRVHFEGTQHMLNAALPDTQVVLVTQIYITRPERYPQVRSIIHWRGEAEAAVRASGVPYTIVRPSWLTDEPGGRMRLRFEQGDTGEGQVSREDVAEVCVQSLLLPQARGKTFEVYAEPGQPLQDWSELFGSLSPDPV